MLHFFAKLGRKPAAKYFMPVVCLSSAIGYYSTHAFLHNQIRDLLAAQTPSGKREEISDNLKELVKSVYIQAQEGFEKPFMELEVFTRNIEPPLIKWFASSTLEPITFGTFQNRTGTLIGLPNFYNYQKPEDIPRELFEVRQLSLFRSPQDPELEKQEVGIRKELAAEGYAPSTVPLTRIDRDSDEGKEYIDTLLLSDNAKKFSIARELFLGDTYRPLIKTSSIFASFALAVNLARIFVRVLGVQHKHLSMRLPLYMLSAIAGLGTYLFADKSLNDYYAKQSDKRAMALGDDYILGASEYYRKRTRRRIILGID